MARVTLATVAEALGVSTMTVSNAYNRPEKLSAELRERILAKADELGYPGPDAVARSLRRGRTGVLGVVLGESLVYAFEDPATVEFFRGLAAGGVPLHIVPSTGGPEDDALVFGAAVDAFIVYALPDAHPLVDAVTRRGLPLVVQSGPEIEGHPLVAIDERAAAAAAADHLRSLGHERLAVLSLPWEIADRADRPLRAGVPKHRVTRGRLEGYGVTVGREVALNDRAHGEAAAGTLLDGPEPPTGLLCMSDELAVGALRAAAVRGIEVPDQLSIVGFDDTPEAARADPPLTTIRQSLRDQGRLCAQLAASGAPESALEPQPWELIVRATTGPCE
ncbi:MAG TPA: LacI family DNA-binding transcriptional regulator [Solirubrobacter sp.]|nr:LacI family DNA-binding transcriptional regulator [Solirubrobacter sp.]